MSSLLPIEIEREILIEDNIRLILDGVDYGAIEGAALFNIEENSLVLTSIIFGSYPNTRQLGWWDKDKIWREALHQINKQIENDTTWQNWLSDQWLELEDA